MAFKGALFGETFVFDDVKTVLARAGEEKTGDQMAGIAAGSVTERVAAKMVLADLPLSVLYENPVVPYEEDEVTRVMVDGLDPLAYNAIKGWTVGELREFLLAAQPQRLRAVTPGLTGEMAAAVAKLMSNMDLVYAAKKLPVVAECNTAIGLPGTFSVRLQPNHPTDSVAGILASTCEGLSYACGDAVLGVNPSTDDPQRVREILTALTDFRTQWAIPTQSCVLAHITTQMAALAQGAPMDLMFQSIGGSEITNSNFGLSMELLDEGYAMMEEQRSSVGANFMYFETGQGSALSSDGHHGADQLTMEARAYGLARHYDPFLVNTVVGFIGPEYLYDGRQITRAALEDHFMGKLLGLPMGVDVCYTNHARADLNDMDNITLLLAAAGCNFIMGVPASDDIMLMYQSTAFHDSAAARELLQLRPTAPFEARMEELGILQNGRLTGRAGDPGIFGRSAAQAKKVTSARVGVGRAGARMRTATNLQLRADHSVAMDAVWNDSDCPCVDPLGFYRIRSLVASKEEYIRRPDRARCFTPEALEALYAHAAFAPDVQVIAADGLSPRAIEANIEEMFALVRTACAERGYTFGTPVFVKYGRVATMDKIADALQAKVTLLFVGERPGLATNESMSCYMAYESSAAKPESQRNVVSNIHRAGLPVAAAAAQIMALVEQMFAYETSGVALNHILRGSGVLAAD
ncbi:MAG: ethanolamine ammonia-lyase subunit EutC [Oscillospiraceae bacterium]|jgi:ethanolamine ammonia-lyase large subunit|nr:ethanolamine ammonia-lyase subunit EutC [Oscillospiraceae bacterium]